MRLRDACLFRMPACERLLAAGKRLSCLEAIEAETAAAGAVASLYPGRPDVAPRREVNLSKPLQIGARKDDKVSLVGMLRIPCSGASQSSATWSTFFRASI